MAESATFDSFVPHFKFLIVPLTHIINHMGYLSPQIEALMKLKKLEATSSLIKKEVSCGIFQDYGTLEDKQEKTD